MLLSPNHPLLASDFAYRLAQGALITSAYADARTTELGLDRGAQEVNPALGESPGNGRLYGVTLAVTVVEMVIASCAYRGSCGYTRPHRKAAIGFLLTMAVIRAAAAIHNHGVARD